MSGCKTIRCILNNETVMNRGFVLLQPKRAPKRVVNIRDDKAQTAFWKQS